MTTPAARISPSGPLVSPGPIVQKVLLGATNQTPLGGPMLYLQALTNVTTAIVCELELPKKNVRVLGFNLLFGTSSVQPSEVAEVNIQLVAQKLDGAGTPNGLTLSSKTASVIPTNTMVKLKPDDFVIASGDALPVLAPTYAWSALVSLANASYSGTSFLYSLEIVYEIVD